jgi:hypothetical protein
MKDLTESEVQESCRIMVLCIPKVPLQGFSSVPAESALALYCNIEVDTTPHPNKSPAQWDCS